MSDEWVRIAGGANAVVTNDLEKVTVKTTLNRLIVEALKRPSCRVEGSETARICSSSAAEIEYQRFFAPLRMTLVLNASTLQPFNVSTNR